MDICYCDLNSEEIFRKFNKKELQKKYQIKFKIGMLITRKGNKLYVKWEDYNNHCVKSIQTQSFFWSVFSCIWTEYEKILRISPYSVQMQRIRTRENFLFGRFCTQ